MNTARDVVEHNRALAPVPVITAALILSAVLAGVLGAAFDPRVEQGATFTAGLALLTLGLRDWLARVDAED